MVTRAEIRTRVLDYADMTSSGFPVTARVDEYIDDALSELHDMLVDSHEDYFKKVHNIVLVPGTEEYALPLDFYKALKVFVVTNGTRYRMDRFNLDTIDGYSIGPSISGDVELWYIPTYTPLVGDLVDIDIKIAPGWERFVSLHAAIQLLNREESDPSALMSELNKIQSRIIKMIEPRDTGEANTIADCSGRWDPTTTPTGSYFKYRIMGNSISFITVEYTNG